MSFIEDIKELSFSRGVQIFLIAFGNLVAPFWFIFQFAFDIYEHSDFSKLLIISLSIGIPISLLRVIIDLFLDPEVDKSFFTSNSPDNFFSHLGKVSVFTGYSLYFPCIVTFFYPMRLNEAIHSVIFIYIGATVYQIKKYYDHKRKLKNQSIKKPE